MTIYFIKEPFTFFIYVTQKVFVSFNVFNIIDETIRINA